MAKKAKDQNFLGRLYARMRELFKGQDIVTREQFEEVFKSARGHAGGKAAPSAAQMAAEADPAGVAIMLPVPAELAQQLAIAGGLAAEDLHVTICHLGTVEQFSSVQLAEILLAVRDASLCCPPVAARISGMGRFVGDGQDALYLSVDSPELGDLYECVEEHLAASGYLPSDDHGFTPHITLRYLEPGAEAPLETIEPLDLVFHQLALWAGPARESLPLLGMPEGAEDDLAEAEAEQAPGLPPQLQQALGALADGSPIPNGMLQRPTMHELAELAAAGHTHRLFNAIAAAEAPDWIPFLPKPGTYSHPRYGQIAITRERIARFVANFTSGIYQDRLPIDAEHETKLSGAVGWIIGMRQNADGSADARAEWTDRGRAFFADNRFRYFSPEWYDVWTRPETGAPIADVAIGGALTTRPFFKDPALRPLFASEGSLLINDPIAQGESMGANELTELQQQLAELKAQNAQLLADQTAAKTAAEAAQANSTQLAEQVRKMAAEQQQARFGALIQNSGARWFGEDAGHRSILGLLASQQGEDSAEFRAYVAQQNGIAQALRSSSAYNELGGDGQGQTESATEQLERLARERASKESISYADALRKVAGENPKLYEQHSADSYVRTKGAE